MSVGSAAERAVGALAGDAHVKLADGQAFAPRHLDDDLLPSLLRVGERHVGQRPVERIRRNIRSQHFREIGDAELGVDQRLQPLVLVLGLGLGCARPPPSRPA